MSLNVICIAEPEEAYGGKASVQLAAAMSLALSALAEKKKKPMYIRPKKMFVSCNPTL